MAQLIIFLSPKEQKPTPSEIGQLRYKGGTPRLKEKGAKRVINLAYYNPELNYGELARDICIDAGDKYYGHEIK